MEWTLYAALASALGGITTAIVHLLCVRVRYRYRTHLANLAYLQGQAIEPAKILDAEGQAEASRAPGGLVFLRRRKPVDDGST